MPITIQLPNNGSGLSFGPGLTISYSTDLIGPIPTDENWVITVSLNPDGGAQTFQFTQPTNGQKIGSFQPWVTLNPVVNTNFTPTAGQTVHVQAELRKPSNVVDDSGTVTALWDTTVGLPTLIQHTAQGGFTVTDRNQLQEVHTATQVLGVPGDLTINTPSGLVTTTLARLFSRTTLDQLTLQEVTNGPTCEPVRATFSIWYYGVVVRVTTIAPELEPKTPDNDWYYNDLAVLRMFRGGDLRLRRGIHTPTFQTDPPWEWGWNIRNLIEFLGGPPAETLAVDWRTGCCGQVFLVKLP